MNDSKTLISAAVATQNSGLTVLPTPDGSSEPFLDGINFFNLIS